MCLLLTSHSYSFSKHICVQHKVCLILLSLPLSLSLSVFEPIVLSFFLPLSRPSVCLQFTTVLRFFLLTSLSSSAHCCCRTFFIVFLSLFRSVLELFQSVYFFFPFLLVKSFTSSLSVFLCLPFVCLSFCPVPFMRECVAWMRWKTTRTNNFFSNNNIKTTTTKQQQQLECYGAAMPK